MIQSAADAGLRSRLLARLPLRARRRAFRAVFRATCLVRPALGSGLGLHFQKILRLPRSQAAHLDREAAFYDWMAELEWLSLTLRSAAGIRRDMAHMTVSDPAVLRQVAETGRTVVLAPLHMGAYTACLASLMFRFFPGRPLLILRRRDDMPLETRVMERIREFGVDMRFLKVTDRADYLAAIRFAKKGAVIVAFCDLPPSYGMPAAMPMFGYDLGFAFGLDGLARLTDAIVLPLTTLARLDGDEIRPGAPFEVRGTGPDARADAVAHIRRHIRSALLSAPEQWHLWPTLGEYLPSHETIVLPRPDGAFAEAAE